MYSFGLAGDFKYKDCPLYPGEPAVMPDISATASMMQFFMSEWMLDNLGSAFYKSGHLHKTITQADLPDKVCYQEYTLLFLTITTTTIKNQLLKHNFLKVPIQLNTTFFRFMLPKLYDLYPNCAMRMYIIAGNVSGTEPMKDPSFVISPSGVTTNLEAATILQVVAQNGTIVDAITLDMTIESAAKFSIVNGTSLIGALSLTSMNITLQVRVHTTIC